MFTVSIFVADVAAAEIADKPKVESIVNSARQAYRNGLYEVAARQFAQALNSVVRRLISMTRRLAFNRFSAGTNALAIWDDT